MKTFASWLLLSVLFTTAPSLAQQFTLKIPIRALAQDSARPSPTTWLATEGGIFRSPETGAEWRNVYIRPSGQVQPVVRFIHVVPDNPRIVYLASDMDTGGIWKSVDGGTVWEQMNKGLPPTGTIDAFINLPAARLTFYAKVGTRIFKSTDGGATWTARGTLPVNAAVFEVNRETPSLMFAALNNAVYRSRDEGATWFLSQVFNGGVITSILVDPSDSNIVHMAMAGLRAVRPGLYRSVNGGERFDEAATFDVDRLLPNRLISDPTGRTVYAAYDEDGYIFRTEDKGFKWEVLLVSAGAGFTTLAIDPVNPRVLFAGTARGVFRSDNAGFNWRDVSGPAKPTLSRPPLPLDFVLPSGAQGLLQISLRVAETNQWTLPIAASAEGGSWLSLNGATTITPATPTVSVDASALEPGEYTGAIRVDSAAAANAPLRIPVKLTVLGPRPSGRAYTIATMAGNGQRGNFGDNQPATRATLGDIDSLAVDRDGNVFVTDPSSSVVRRIGTDGVIVRYAGTGRRGDSGEDSQALLAQIDSPAGIAVDSVGTVYFCDSATAKLRRVTPDGTIKTLARDIGPCRGVALDSARNVYLTVPAAHVILRVTPEGRVSFFAGVSGVGGFRGDGGPPAGALFNTPLDVFIDARDRIYIADTGNHRVRRIEAGVVTTIAGSGILGYQGEGPDATKVALASPSGVTADADGNVYFGDTDSHRVRMIAPNGSIRLVAGTGVRGFNGDNGPAPAAQIAGPQDVALEPNGNLLTAEAGNLRIRRLSAPPPPVLPEVASGPLNWADASSRLAPGTIFRLAGSELAAETAARGDSPWLSELAGVQVTLNGQPVPLTLVTPSEIVGLIPFHAALGAGTMVVVREDSPGRELAVTIESAAPAILLAEPGRAIAANEDGSLNSATYPAAPESLLTVYFTGSGLTENPPAGGAGAGNQSKLLQPVQVQFGELSVQPVVARLTPGRTGIAEVRFRVPVNQAGDYPVAIRVGDALSAPALVSTAPPPAQ